MLDLAVDRLAEDLPDQPAARARFLHTAARAYTNLGRFEKSEAVLREALELRESVLGADRLEVADTLEQLGIVLRRGGRPLEAIAPLERTLAIRSARPEPDPKLMGLAHNHLGNLWWALGRPEDAEASHREALAWRRRNPDLEPGELAESLNNLAVALREQDRWSDAEPVFRSAIELMEETFGPEHPRTTAGRYNLALVEEELGRWDSATELFRLALERWEAVYGPSHPRSLLARHGLAGHLRRRGRWAELVQLAERWREIVEEAGDEDDRRHALSTHARALLKSGQLAPARALYARLLELQRESGADSSDRAWTETRLATIDLEDGRLADAETRLRSLLDAGVSESSSLRAHVERRLGLVLLRGGDLEEGERHLRRSLEIAVAASGDDSLAAASSRFELARLHSARGEIQEARGLARQALESRTSHMPPDHSDVAEARSLLETVESRLR